jgi:hypothetical protein
MDGILCTSVFTLTHCRSEFVTSNPKLIFILTSSYFIETARVIRN